TPRGRGFRGCPWSSCRCAVGGRSGLLAIIADSGYHVPRHFFPHPEEPTVRRLLPALALLGGLAMPLSAAPAPGPGIEEEPYGALPDGTKVTAYTLTNKNGLKAKIITYGGIVTELHVPDKDGKLADVVLGFDDLKGYLSGGSPYFGCITGR